MRPISLLLLFAVLPSPVGSATVDENHPVLRRFRAAQEELRTELRRTDSDYRTLERDYARFRKRVHSNEDEIRAIERRELSRRRVDSIDELRLDLRANNKQYKRLRRQNNILEDRIVELAAKERRFLRRSSPRFRRISDEADALHAGVKTASPQRPSANPIQADRTSLPTSVTQSVPSDNPAPGEARPPVNDGAALDSMLERALRDSGIKGTSAKKKKAKKKGFFRGLFKKKKE